MKNKNLKTNYPFIIPDSIETEYKNAKRCIGFCNETKKGKLIVEGEKALELINHYSHKKMNFNADNTCYAYIKKYHKFIDELLVIRLTEKKYLILTNKITKILKLFSKIKRRYNMTIVKDVSIQYAFFSLHGNNTLEYLSEIANKNLFKVNQQGYVYHYYLCYCKDTSTLIKHFKTLNFVQISVEVVNLFLYNNSVILNLDKIPRKYQLSVINMIYGIENKKSKKRLNVDIFELTTTSLVVRKAKVFNNKRKKSGIIHNIYKLPNKKFHFLQVIYYGSEEKFLLLKQKKNEILLKKLHKV